jgi:transcriptional regulator with XRE-family HTH domain
MTFGSRIRELRQAKNLTLRDVAKKVKVTFTYVSKIENQKLSYGEFPSNEMIMKLARALEADPDELLLLAEKIWVPRLTIASGRSAEGLPRRYSRP